MKIENCTFTGVKFDGQAMEAIADIAKALLNLTELFKAQNIRVDSLLKVADDPDEGECKKQPTFQNPWDK
jgi:hypothetical protein